jgi:hypothetical protein
MLKRFYLFTFFTLINVPLFCQTDSLNRSTLYFYHRNNLFPFNLFPFVGHFKLNGERVKLKLNSYIIKSYPAGDVLEVETKTHFKRRKKVFSLENQKSYYFKCTPISTLGRINFKLTLVEDSIGQKAIKKIIEKEKEDE